MKRYKVKYARLLAYIIMVLSELDAMIVRLDLTIITDVRVCRSNAKRYIQRYVMFLLCICVSDCFVTAECRRPPAPILVNGGRMTALEAP